MRKRNVRNARMALSMCFAFALSRGVASAAPEPGAPEPTEPKPANPRLAPPTPEGGSHDRTLAGYTFITPMLGDTAFPATYVGIRQSVVYAQVPNFTAPGADTFTLQTTGLVDDLELGLKLSGAVGLFGTLSGQLTSGLNGRSILVAGSSYEVAASGGIIVRLLRAEKTGTQVAVRAFVGHGGGEGIDLLPLAQSLTNDARNFDVAHATETVQKELFTTSFVPSSYTKGGGSIHVAQTILPFLALQASFSLSAVAQKGMLTDRTIGSSISVSGVDDRESAAIALSFDAKSFGLPMAAMAEYSLSSGRMRPSTQVSTELAHVTALGLYYSGSRSLQLGFGAATQLGMRQVPGFDELGKAHVSDRPMVVLGQILIRHEF